MASPNLLALLVVIFVTIIALLFLNSSMPNRSDALLPDRDIEGVSQNHSDVVAYIRQLHILRPSVNRTYNLKNPEVDDNSQNGQARVVAKLFKNKRFGTFFEAGAYNGEELSNTLFLEKNLNWTGLLVEPDPWNFWALKKRNRRAHILQGCVSPTIFMREVTFRQGDTQGRVVDSFEKRRKGIFTRVKCFPLFSLLLAQNLTTLDFLSLDVEGDELNILKTVPWDQVDITALLIEVAHIPEGEDALRQFLKDKNYNLHSAIGDDLLFVKKKKNKKLLKGSL